MQALQSSKYCKLIRELQIDQLLIAVLEE